MMIREWIAQVELSAKIAVFILALVTGSVALVAGTREALAATLKSEGVITGEYIRLGDVFDGVENGDYVLGPAPQPGKDMILNARTLYKIASALDVKWSPSSSTEQIILRREASIIPQDRITDALSQRIADEGITEKFSVDIVSGPTELILPADAAEDFEITAFRFDAQNDAFNATLVAPSAKNPLKRANITGRIERLIAVPVLRNTLKNGDIIATNDLDWIDLPMNKIAAGTATDAAALVNMTPRRTMASGKPVLLNDLEQPRMVQRGDTITLVFANGPMMLTTQGKALQAGALGETVRVANADSNKNLQGVVTASREVTVR